MLYECWISTDKAEPITLNGEYFNRLNGNYYIRLKENGISNMVNKIEVKMKFGAIYSAGDPDDRRLILYEENGQRSNIETLLIRSFYYVQLNTTSIRRRKKRVEYFYDNRNFTYDDKNYFHCNSCKSRKSTQGCNRHIRPIF